MLKISPINLYIFLLSIFSLFFSKLYAQDWKLTPENITRAFERQAEMVSRNPLRPAYHLVPPAGGMGDPNGGIYYNGYYHIFYGLAPFSPSLGGWFWAHARSRDLVHWEHMKPGLTPAYDLGLQSVVSGSTIIAGNGQPLAFYCAGKDGSMKFWRAEFTNKDLSEWDHKGKNPVLTLAQPGIPDFDSFWRDPFVFSADGRTFLIACADLLNESYVPIPIFEARNEELTEWDYKGILFTVPKYRYRNLEVPELRKLDGKWILLASTDAPVDRTVYFTGEFDTKTLKFIPDNEGILDYSSHYYAQETIPEENGDLYVMAWIPGWDRPFLPDYRADQVKNNSKYQNGCFALPRKLSIDKDGNLIREPVDALKELRTDHFSVTKRDLPVDGPETGFVVLDEVRGDQLEIRLDLDLNTASFCGLNVLCDENGKGGCYIIWSGDVLNVEGVKVPMPEWKPGASLDLQIFIDKQIVEVFVNGGKYSVTRLVNNKYINGDRVALTSLGGTAKLKYLNAWKIKTIN